MHCEHCGADALRDQNHDKGCLGRDTARADLSTDSEIFTFPNLGELRNWLNRFEKTDLTTVVPANGDRLFALHWIPNKLSDGSQVFDVRISTV